MTVVFDLEFFSGGNQIDRTSSWYGSGMGLRDRPQWRTNKIKFHDHEAPVCAGEKKLRTSWYAHVSYLASLIHHRITNICDLVEFEASMAGRRVMSYFISSSMRPYPKITRDVLALSMGQAIPPDVSA
ncbi:hypothetical protein FRB98_001860 [Tulasnella sp. 332]|nr:hypothetical protein FRB98_001860 [Tulasnella sp. 332]